MPFNVSEKMTDNRLLDIKNSDCLLVEFVNEEHRIQTGFISWLQESDAKNVENLIKNREEVLIQWPDIDTSEANLIKKKLKKAKFSKHPVIILATGGNFLLLHYTYICSIFCLVVTILLSL